MKTLDNIMHAKLIVRGERKSAFFKGSGLGDPLKVVFIHEN